MRKILMGIALLGALLYANDYRTIQRNAPVVTRDAKTHHQIKDFGEYHALLIWVEEYAYLPRLQTPRKDIEAVAKILEDRYFFDKKNIHILANPKNGDELIFELDKLKNSLGKKDNLLIYYAGHGCAEDNQTGYWTLANGKDISETRVGSVPLNEAVSHTLKKMKSKHILVVSDSCYSGVLTRKSSNGSFGSIDKSEMNYYNKLYEIQSRTVLTSGGLEPVQDGDSLEPNHSVFANSFLRVLKRNQNSIFSLNEKYKDIKVYVFNGANQKPTYEGLRLSNHDVGGDFIFIDKKSIYNIKIDPTPPVPPKPQSSIEKYLIWALVVVSILFLVILIIHFKSRKKISIIDEQKDKKERNPFKEEKVTPKKERLFERKIIKKGGLIYQNQPFTNKYTWQEAKEYAKGLELAGFNDWRLPTISELEALGNIPFYGRYDDNWNSWYEDKKEEAIENLKGDRHFINKKMVENMPENSWFWTSEHKDEEEVWNVGFHLGAIKAFYFKDKNFVLCVRDIKEER